MVALEGCCKQGRRLGEEVYRGKMLKMEERRER